MSVFDTIAEGLKGTPDDLYFWKNRPLRDAKNKVVPARALGIFNRADARGQGLRFRLMSGRRMAVPKKPRPLVSTRRSR